MATSTPNLGLTLPIGNEHVSRQIINGNMMILDESATNFDFNPDVMRDAILAVQDVTHVKIVLNRSDEEVNGIPAKSLLVLVNNGGKTNICQAIYDTNTSGLETAGTLEKEIEGVTIKFSRPSLYALHFNITLEGFTAPSLTNIETSIKNALMTYINRTLQIGEVLSMENVRQIVYNAAGSEAANFRIKDLSCSWSQGTSRDFIDPGWNNKFTMSSGSDVTITSVQSQSSQAIDTLISNIANLQLIQITSATTIASLCQNCPTKEHRYYVASLSNTFSDYPATFMQYACVIHVFRPSTSGTGCQIVINAVSGNNIPYQYIGWYENGSLYWREIGTLTNKTGTCTSTYGTITYVRQANVVTITGSCSGMANNAWVTLCNDAPKCVKAIKFVAYDSSGTKNVSINIENTSVQFYGRNESTSCAFGATYITE